MTTHYKIFLVIMLAACVTGYWLVNRTPEFELPPIKPEAKIFSDLILPDFTTYTQVKEKKQAFFDFVLPLVNEENQRLLGLREKVMELKILPELLEEQRQWIEELADYYRLPEDMPIDEDLMEKLLRRIDQVPTSLALAQSANESSWGTSRFAVEGNNLFGQWCFKQGCGLVPEGREEGARYEVAAFNDPRHSVERYIHNLNTHTAYHDFRSIRVEMREQDQPLSGQKLAEGLMSYSTRGEEYIEELRAMIRFNQLSEYDKVETEPELESKK